MIFYLWIIEVCRQLHKYGGHEWGYVIGKRLHKGTKSKDPTAKKVLHVPSCKGWKKPVVNEVVCSA